MSMSQAQINAKVDSALAAGAKRLAKHRGVPLNVYIADLLAKDLAAHAETIKRQIAEEERELAVERDAINAVLAELAARPTE